MPERTFEHWDAAAGRWSREPGCFVLEVGTSVTAPVARACVSLDTP